MGKMVYRGRAHLLGDGIPLDEGFIPFELAIGRVTDPQKLIPHLFEKISPGFSSRARAGDIAFAGREFGCGKPHVQGFIALKAIGIGVVCTSMPFKNLRRAVAKGLPVITGAPAPAEIAAEGDDIEVDFATGQVYNHTRQQAIALPSMPPILLDVVRRGGMDALLKSWLAEHPEQKAGPEDRQLADAVNSATVTFLRK